MKLNEILKIGEKAYKGYQAQSYITKRVPVLKQKGFDEKTITKMIYFELGFSEISSAIFTSLTESECIKKGSIIGAELGSLVEPGVGTFGGALMGAYGGKKACSSTIGFTSQELSKQMSEQIFANNDSPEKQEIDLSKIKSYINNSPHTILLKDGIKQNVYLQNSQPSINFTREDIAAMDTKTFEQNWDVIKNQMQQGNIVSKYALPQDYSGYVNSELGSTPKIFTREEIKNMSTDEFLNNEKAINFQVNSIGIPSANELQNSTGAVFVHGYTRGDGVQVKDYYRAAPSR
jgi:hypothetical protein